EPRKQCQYSQDFAYTNCTEITRLCHDFPSRALYSPSMRRTTPHNAIRRFPATMEVHNETSQDHLSSHARKLHTARAEPRSSDAWVVGHYEKQESQDPECHERGTKGDCQKRDHFRLPAERGRPATSPPQGHE